MSEFGPAPNAPVTTRALWNWTTATGTPPVVAGYPPFGQPTKTGLTPADFKAFIGIPVQQYGNPPVPISDTTILQWIRWAEDDTEQSTNIRLCQTWVAAPAAKSAASARQSNLDTRYFYQQLGIDYDFSEAAYDFDFPRWQDEGWGYMRMRWRPVQSVEYTQPSDVYDINNITGIKNVAFVYPLLNEYLRMPNSWIVEDQLRGLVRFVPSTNVAMLPLFSMQLAFMGFAQSVPGGIWFQYSAGLTANDYNSAFSFIQQLVLARAAVTALGVMQTSINLGATETTITIDGLQYRTRYAEGGALAGSIKNFAGQVKDLTKRAKSKVAGPMFGVL